MVVDSGLDGNKRKEVKVRKSQSNGRYHCGRERLLSIGVLVDRCLGISHYCIMLTQHILFSLPIYLLRFIY